MALDRNDLISKYRHLFPSRNELATKSLFATTEQERQDAAALLAQLPEDAPKKDAEHDWTDHPMKWIMSLPPSADETPAGKAIAEFLAGVPMEDATDNSWEREVFTELLADKAPDPVEQSPSLPPQLPDSPSPPAVEIESAGMAAMRRALTQPQNEIKPPQPDPYLDFDMNKPL